MDFLSELMELFWFQALWKILLGALLTGVIGLERSSLNKPAGFGTHAILGTSAVLVVLLSEYMSLNSDVDMSRIPAQLLSGIGFIGAGTILRNGLNVKGVTTAAGLLAVTCIGLSVGAGFYFGAILATIIVYLTLAYSHKISDKFERYTALDIEIQVTKNANETLETIKKYINTKKIDLRGLKRAPQDGKPSNGEIIELIGSFDSRYIKKNTIIEDLISLEYVSSVTDAEE